MKKYGRRNWRPNFKTGKAGNDIRGEERLDYDKNIKVITRSLLVVEILDMSKWLPYYVTTVSCQEPDADEKPGPKGHI